MPWLYHRCWCCKRDWCWKNQKEIPWHSPCGLDQSRPRPPWSGSLSPSATPRSPRWRPQWPPPCWLPQCRWWRWGRECPSLACWWPAKWNRLRSYPTYKCLPKQGWILNCTVCNKSQCQCISLMAHLEVGHHRTVLPLLVLLQGHVYCAGESPTHHNKPEHAA